MNKTPSISTSLLFVFIAIVFSNLSPAHSQSQHDFLHCLNNSGISGFIYSQTNSSYLPILNSMIINLRFTTPSTPKPFIIIRPEHKSQLRAVVLCSKNHGIQIRTRSGGHDFEGLSYTSRFPSVVPFVVVDMINFNKIKVDVKRKTAWVEAGATVGQLYYKISKESDTLAFPAGECPTIGIGGYVGGGGYGPLLRKYGLAADNAIDARLMDVNGKILDRKSMGEELFWAIRGGGGASFGVILAWKLKLVNVPKVMTVFSINRILEQNATELIHKWQHVAPNFPKEVFFQVSIVSINSTEVGKRTILATFQSSFLGGVNKLLQLFEERFPELGVKRKDCTEVSWIQSALFYAGYPVNVSSQILESRTPPAIAHFKIKLDYVQQPISTLTLKTIWKILYEREVQTTQLLFIAYGGRNDEISESALPFPHRAGNLYTIRYLVAWNSEIETPPRELSWIRRLYRYMTPYVSMSPRAAYLNYRDLDLGINNKGNTSYAQAKVWGLKYFKNNFNRLVRAKTMIDPNNFFRNEQSIPPFTY